ncbi:MAG: PepSY-associated TM helix domain-containing protein [Gammaproteobacteria bacterium]
MSRLQINSRRQARWRSWHIWSGLVSAIVLINLVITGVLINHTDGLQLDQRPVALQPLLKWYGFKPPGRAVRFYLPDAQVIQLDQRVYLDKQPLMDSVEPLLAVCPVAEGIAVITPIKIILLTAGGELIEAVDLPESLAKQIDQVACTTDGPLLESATNHWVADPLFTQWQQRQHKSTLNWQFPELLSSKAREQAYMLYHRESLTWERLLLDLHSGRLFGFAGVLLVDAAAILLLLQIVTGLYMFWQSPRPSPPSREER